MEFEWDDNNIDHLARHRISPEEAEQVVLGPALRLHGGTDAPDRVKVLGPTFSGRHLAIIYQIKPGMLIRPFTGWDMDHHERELYDRQINEA